jgi:hypothetical protein
MLGNDLAQALDPTLLAAACGYTLDAWQSELMRSTADRVLLLASRQAGKTFCTALMGLSTAVMQPGALVIIVSPSQRQSAEFFGTLLSLYHALDGAPELRQESALRATLANDSRILALPGRDFRDHRGTTRRPAGGCLIKPVPSRLTREKR